MINYHPVCLDSRADGDIVFFKGVSGVAAGFICPSCQKYVEANLTAGQQSSCPFCGQTVVMTQPSEATQSHIFCACCGLKNAENNYKCTRCGFVLRGNQPVVITTSDEFGSLIPYRNAHALWAYYLGLFSLIPCFGFFLSIPAVILGVMGLRRAKINPQIKGKVHAIVGIVFGGLCLLGYIALLVFTVAGIIEAN